MGGLGSNLRVILVMCHFESHMLRCIISSKTPFFLNGIPKTYRLICDKKKHLIIMYNIRDIFHLSQRKCVARGAYTHYHESAHRFFFFY